MTRTEVAGPATGPVSHYDVLGVTFDATDEQIRKQYHGIVRTLHPDKRRPGTENEVLERFHRVQSAHRVLSDPTRRLIYDLRNFGRSSTESGDIISDTAEAKLIKLQQEQAQRDANNMEVIHRNVLRREQAKQGIIVSESLYGNLLLRPDKIREVMQSRRTIEVDDVQGPCCDVSLPLQCSVERHKIVLPGGAYSSKADLPGFYNPAPLELDLELSLYVRYEFKGRSHEVTVGDRETLEIPKRAHVIQSGKPPRGPFSSANVTLMMDVHQCGDNSPSRRAAATGFRRRASSDGSETPEPSAGASRARSAAEAAELATTAYRQHWLTTRDEGEASPKEFVLVVCTAALLMLRFQPWRAVR